ncbi:MAG TPA: response regulator, partial [Polyangia bacterium]
KGIVGLHGGDVTARSDGAGAGAELTVRLPLAAEVAAAAPPAGAPAPPRPAPRRVLIIEDNGDAAETLRDALMFGGHEVQVARDGRKGLEQARRLAPEVVLCDIGLPLMDGYAVARQLRADAQLRAVYLVALTGYAAPDDLARAQAAGFDAHVAKPPSLETLERILARAGTPPPSPGGEPPGAGGACRRAS